MASAADSPDVRFIDAFVEVTSISSPPAAPPFKMLIPPAVVVIWRASSAVPVEDRIREASAAPA